MLGKKITAHAGQTTVVITLQNEKLTVRHVDLTNFEVEHARGLLLEEVRRVQHLVDPSQLSYGCEREDISAYLISIV